MYDFVKQFMHKNDKWKRKACATETHTIIGANYLRWKCIPHTINLKTKRERETITNLIENLNTIILV